MKKGSIFLILLFLASASHFSASAQKTRASIRVKKTQTETPNIISSRPLEFGRVAAFSEGRGVWLEWRTAYEFKNLGFVIYRVDGKQREVVSASIVAGSFLQSGEETAFEKQYNYFDQNGDLNSAYQIESVDAGGNKKLSDLIYPQYASDLTQVAENSAGLTAKRTKKAQSAIVQNNLNLPVDLRSQVEDNQSAPDLNRHREVVAQPGVKIGVKQEGMYRVTRASLQSAGFDVSSAPANWQLYLDGIEQAILVGASGDYIEFYGRTVDTPESDTRIYYLIAGAEPGKRMTTTVRRPFGGNVLAESYNQTFVKKDRVIYAPGLLNGEAENYFGAVVVATPSNINFNLSGVDLASSAASLRIAFQGLTFTPHEIRVVINGQELAPVFGNNRDLMVGNFEIPTAFLQEGANTLQLRAPSGTSVVESIRVNFNRLYLAQQNRLSCYVHNYRVSVLEGFTSPNIRVFDLTDVDRPRVITDLPIQPNGAGYSVRLAANRGRVLYAAEETGLLPAASVAPNVPSTLSTPTHNGRLLIIAHKDFLTPANNWAAYRQGQGFATEVVDVADIYDEYSFGVLSSTAIRDFLQYARNSWQTAPQYVLLIGDASYDSRNYEGLGYFNLVPTKLVDTLYTETGSDEALADFNDDGLAEMSIGRIPARNAQAVTDALNKVTNFELTAGQAFDRGAIFASDIFDGYDFEALSQRLANQLPTSINKVMINRGQPNAQTVLINEMNNGRYLVNYTGHGNADVWASSSFFGKNNVPQLTNANNLSLFVMLSCLNGYFIPPSDFSVSLSERLLEAQNGGAVAVWSSTGLTTPDVQEVMATRFYQQLGTGAVPRLGDLIKDAKAVVSGGRDVRLSWVLLGDPLLKVR